MATGFGFSAGDIFLALKLIKDSIEAVNESKGASADYEALVKEIVGLQDGLDAVEELQSDPSLSVKQASALERSIRSCQESVNGFFATISKYQPHLHTNTSGFHSNFRKIKWSICKKDDVQKFRAQLGRHASSINMLLISFQAKQTLDANRAGSSFPVKTREDEDDRIAEMLRGLSLEQRQFFLITMQQNKQLLQGIEDLKSMLQTQTIMPPQVLLQQPVILLDPFGKTAPFHLDFIDSSECFIAVLKARFTNAGVTPAGLTKLENRDFLIQDTRRRRQIDLDRNWEAVFRPGQHVDMSMIFHRFVCPPSTCPACLEENVEADEQIHCKECGLYYQNVQAISSRSRDWKRHLPSSHNDVSVAGEEIPYLLRQPGKDPELRVFRPIRESEDELFEGYRRVQLVSQSLDLLDGKFPALQLIEDFCRFAELLKGVAEDISPFLPEIQDLHARTVQHILQQRSSFPAFASFSQIEQVRRLLAKESQNLRQEIDKLVQHLYNDPDTKDMMNYIKEIYPSEHGKDYYTGVLTRMVSEFTKPTSTRARSAERMQWLLLDSRAK